MASIFDEVWASDSDAVVDPPSVEEIRRGFRCGKAPLGIFNWLFQTLMSAINDLNIGDMVNKNRLVSTTEGIQGGGALDTDLTLRLDIAGLEEETAIDNDDLLVVFDISANKHVSMRRQDFVAGLGGEGGGITTATNVGTGDGLIFKAVSGTALQLRKIKADAGLAVAVTGDDITLSLADRGSELTYA